MHFFTVTQNEQVNTVTVTPSAELIALNSAHGIKTVSSLVLPMAQWLILAATEQLTPNASLQTTLAEASGLEVNKSGKNSEVSSLIKKLSHKVGAEGEPHAEGQFSNYCGIPVLLCSKPGKNTFYGFNTEACYSPNSKVGSRKKAATEVAIEGGNEPEANLGEAIAEANEALNELSLAGF